MISFETDYIEGCHESILNAFIKTNMIQVSGYGEDPFTLQAKDKIRKTISCPEADIYFLNGGTQTNQLVIDTMLEPYEGVISCTSGHVSVHEAGAIEFSGHKVLPLPEHQGKLDPVEVEDYVKTFYADGNHEHMVFPGMVYISHPTEVGTLYTKKELETLSDICHENHMVLYLDGARLGYGLNAEDTDVTMQDIAQLCDVFYIGGTKVGALSGEALVFTKNNTPSHFVTRIKQHGALLAKGRLLGVQFDTLFTDDLYMKLGRHAIEKAEELKQMLKENHYRFFMDSPTNQQFIILSNQVKEQMEKEVKFSFWDKYDDTHTVVRFVTSWATTDENMQELKKILEKYAEK